LHSVWLIVASVVALQSIARLNPSDDNAASELARYDAKVLAAKLEKEPESERIDKAWEHVLSRRPTADEKTAARKFLDQQRKNLGSESAALQELGRSLFNFNEFLYVD